MHSRLMAGQFGHAWVLVSTVLTIVLAATGVILWWPRKIFASIVLFVLALSGLLIASEEVAGRALKNVARSSHQQASAPASAVAPGRRAVSLDAAVDAAAVALPAARLTFVALPIRPSDTFTVYGQYPEDTNQFGRSRVWVDQYSGRVLATTSTREAALDQRVMNSFDPMHMGDLFGPVYKFVVLLTGISIPGQIVTGVIIWIRRLRRPMPRA